MIKRSILFVKSGGWIFEMINNEKKNLPTECIFEVVEIDLNKQPASFQKYIRQLQQITF